MRHREKAQQFILQRSWTCAISKTQSWKRCSEETKDVLYFVETSSKMTLARLQCSPSRDVPCHIWLVFNVLDVISSLPGCAGQASDAVSAYTQVKIGRRAKVFVVTRIREPNYLDSSSTIPRPEIMGRNSRSRGTA